MRSKDVTFYRKRGGDGWFMSANLSGTSWHPFSGARCTLSYNSVRDHLRLGHALLDVIFHTFL